MAADGGFSGDDLAAAIMAGNEAVMQWYALTHQTTIPVNPNTPIYEQPLPGGGRLTLPSNTLLILALGAVALVLLLK